MDSWTYLLTCLFDPKAHGSEFLPGPCLFEWLMMAQFDFDDVDRFYIDSETIGGG